MKKYNKFYFLHVPKTGGRFFTKYIVRPIEKKLEENGVRIIQLPANVNKHGGWHKDIDDDTYVVSILRDPAEFSASLVAHMVASENNLMDDNNDQIIKDNSRELDIPKDLLFQTIEELKYLKNFQSQNFVLTPEDTNLVSYSQMIYKKNMEVFIDKELLYERLNRTNLMIRHADLKSMDYSILINKILDDIGIRIDVDISLIDKDLYKNNNSESLFNKLTDEDIQRVYKNFMIDKEVYDKDSLFWNKKF